MPTKQEVENILKQIPDPEIGVSLFDLGLVYNIDINEEKKLVTVTMTLTTIGCPLFSLIADPIKEKVGELPEVSEVIVELTFEPPWNIDRMTEDAKMQLGLS